VPRWDNAPPTHNRVLKALKSVKNPGNTFNLNPKWKRTLPSFGNFSWDMHRVSPNPNIKTVI
jgi:hypothetical protein